MEKTDLSQVKAVAHWLLNIEVHKTEYSPMIVQHPFASSGVTMLPGIKRIVDITASTEDLTAWREFIGKQIDRAEDAYGIFMLLNKTYALTFLKYAKEHLSAKDLSLILADAWMQAENPNMDTNVSKKELVSMFKEADKAVMMDAEESKRLAELGESVTVYRGVTPYNARNVKALSWTLDKAKAKWFANRFGQSGTVYKAEIGKQDILAFFMGRNESEVVLNPYKLKNITEVTEI